MKRRHIPEHPAWCTRRHDVDSPHAVWLGQCASDRAVLDIALTEYPDRGTTIVVGVTETTGTVVHKLDMTAARGLRDCLAAGIEAVDAS